MSAVTKDLARELTPVRVNVIAMRSPPIEPFADPTDVAALAIHLMSNPTLTGATFDVNG